MVVERSQGKLKPCGHVYYTKWTKYAVHWSVYKFMFPLEKCARPLRLPDKRGWWLQGFNIMMAQQLLLLILLHWKVLYTHRMIRPKIWGLSEEERCKKWCRIEWPPDIHFNDYILTKEETKRYSPSKKEKSVYQRNATTGLSYGNDHTPMMRRAPNGVEEMYRIVL